MYNIVQVRPRLVTSDSAYRSTLIINTVSFEGIIPSLIIDRRIAIVVGYLKTIGPVANTTINPEHTRSLLRA